MPIQAGPWGLVAASVLLIGAVAALTLQVPRRVVALVMAFGAGALVSALETGGDRVGLATALGFAAAFLLSRT